MSINKKNQVIAHLPNGKDVVLAKFNSHKEAYNFMNKIWLGAN